MKKIFLSLLALLFIAVAAHATDYSEIILPEPMEEYVNDFAGLISAEDTDQIRGLLKKVEKDAGIEITVVTIAKLRDYNAPRDLRVYTQLLFDKWGVGDAKRNDGVMILLSKEDREVRIEMGRAYKYIHNPDLQKVVDDQMLPQFKKGDYSRGLIEGTQAVVAIVTRPVSWAEYYKWELILGVLTVVSLCAGISCLRSGNSGWGYVFFTLAGAFLLFVLKGILLGRGGKRGGFGGGRSGGGGAGGRW